MNHVPLFARLAVVAALGTCFGCSRADDPDGETAQAEPVPIEPFPTEPGVKPLDHQALPLPENPPVRFKKLFTIQGTAKLGLFILAFSPDGKVLAVGRWGNEIPDVTLWDVKRRKLLHVLPHGRDMNQNITAVAFVPPGDRLVTGYWTLNKALLWDVRTGKLLDTLETGEKVGDFITGLAAFPDGKRVICCAGSGLILWDLEAKTHKTLSLEEHVPVKDSWRPTSPPRCDSVAFTADGSRFATTVNQVAYAPRILLWDAKTCQVTRSIPMQRGNHRFALAPDGSSFAADYYDPSLPHSYDPTVSRDVVGVWDMASGKKVLAGRLFNWGLYDLAYTPDGKYLLAAGVHKDIMEAGGKPVIGVWDLATGKVVNSLPMPAYGPLRIAISPDNKLLAVPGRNIDIYAIEYTRK